MDFSNTIRRLDVSDTCGTCNVWYAAGKASVIKAYVVDDAAFNVEVSNDVFKLAVPKGVVAVDYRNGNPHPYRISDAVDDLVTIMDRGFRAGDVKNPPSNGTHSVVLIAVNAIAVFLLALFIAWRHFQGRRYVKQ